MMITQDETPAVTFAQLREAMSQGKFRPLDEYELELFAGLAEDDGLIWVNNETDSVAIYSFEDGRFEYHQYSDSEGDRCWDIGYNFVERLY